MTTATVSALGLGHIGWSGGELPAPQTRKKSTSAVSSYSEQVSNALLEAQKRLSANKLQRLYGSAFALWTKAGWDGQDARPISSKTIANTMTFFDLIGDLAEGVEVTPEEDGYIQLEWYKAPNKLLSLSFGPSNVLSFSGVFGEGCTTYGAEKFTDAIPESVWSLIRRVDRL